MEPKKKKRPLRKRAATKERQRIREMKRKSERTLDKQLLHYGHIPKKTKPSF